MQKTKRTKYNEGQAICILQPPYGQMLKFKKLFMFSVFINSLQYTTCIGFGLGSDSEWI